MPLGITVMNPPRRTKKARRKAKRRRGSPSAKQRANWARFAAMARRKAGKKRRRRKARRNPSHTTTIRSNPVARRSKRRKARRRGRSGGGASRRGFLAIPSMSEAAPLIGGSLVGFVGVSKLPDFVPDRFMRRADGSVDPNRRLVAKIATGGLLYLIARVLKMRRTSLGILAGAVTNVGYDIGVRVAPQIAPKTLSGDDDDSYTMGGNVELTESQIAMLQRGGMAGNVPSGYVGAAAAA